MDLERVIELLGLEPLDLERGMFRRTFTDEHSTAIYFLLRAGEPSMFHRVPSAELFHHYTGAPAKLLILGAAEGASEQVLGPDLESGQRPQAAVPPGAWQAATSLGEWSLLGATMAPGFSWETFELASRQELLAEWPEASDAIHRHTPERPGAPT